MDIKQLRENLKSDTFKELKKYLEDKLSELKEVDSIREVDNYEMQIIEIKAQKRAYEKLREILNWLGVVEIEPDLRDKRDSFAV